MNIELKNVKHSEFASQETNCFEAKVYVDGKAAFTVHNDGNGGCNYYYPLNGDSGADFRRKFKKVDDYAKTVSEFEFEQVDDVIGDLLTDWLLRRDMKRLLGRKVVFTKKGQKGLYQWGFKGRKKPPASKLDELAQRLESEGTAEYILNRMSENKALEIYKQQGC